MPKPSKTFVWEYASDGSSRAGTTGITLADFIKKTGARSVARMLPHFPAGDPPASLSTSGTCAYISEDNIENSCMSLVLGLVEVAAAGQKQAFVKECCCLGSGIGWCIELKHTRGDTGRRGEGWGRVGGRATGRGWPDPASGLLTEVPTSAAGQRILFCVSSRWVRSRLAGR